MDVSIFPIIDFRLYAEPNVPYNVPFCILGAICFFKRSLAVCEIRMIKFKCRILRMLQMFVHFVELFRFYSSFLSGVILKANLYANACFHICIHYNIKLLKFNYILHYRDKFIFIVLKVMKMII